MALARGLMLKGSSGSSTESDSPQMYTCMCHIPLGHSQDKPRSYCFSFFWLSL